MLVPELGHITLDCESCQLGKHHHMPYPVRVKGWWSNCIAHLDAWGPGHITSKFGLKYFITFVNDYSRVTWLYLMKNSFELFSIIFQNFFAFNNN